MAHLARSDLRGKPQLRPGGGLQRLSTSRRRSSRRSATSRWAAAAPSATSCCRTRSSACAGFEGTTRFTNPTLSRFELNRPFPAFAGISQNQNNIGKLIYDSAQFVANKRWAKGVTINASYTYVPRWTEIGGYVDAVSGLLNEAPYFSQRKHRITASGVWELPWYPRRAQHRGYLLGGWSMAPLLVYQSGQPWDMPGNVDLAPGVDLAEIALRRARRKGSSSTASSRASASATRRPGSYDLLAVSTAYGCTEPYFLIRENFQRRTAMNRYDEFRRPGVLAGGRELREDDADHQQHPAPGASRGVQPLQQPDVRRASVQHGHQHRGLRPHQPQQHRAVELPAVRPAGLPADLLDIASGNAASAAFPESRLKAQGSRLSKTFESTLEDLA